MNDDRELRTTQEDDEYMDACPHTEFLESLHGNQSCNWHIALSELCDNSFDHKAARVQIQFRGKRDLEVLDDGNGCDDMARMMKLGMHDNRRNSGLGRYGVGLKEAGGWLWGVMVIETVCQGYVRSTTVDWEKWRKSGSWRLPKPRPVPALPEQVGTKLTFARIDRSPPDYEKLREKLSYVFAPALEDGKQIVIQRTRRKPMVCAAWKMPPLTDVITTDLVVAGKRASIHVGIIGEGADTSQYGFNYSYEHRNIKNSAFGGKGHSVRRICGQVTLSRDWKLSKNKTDIAEGQDLLEEKLYEICEPIILKAEQQAEVIYNDKFTHEINASLNEIVTTLRKAKREATGKKPGTVSPKGTKRRVRKADKTQPGGDILGKVASRGLRIEPVRSLNGLITDVDLTGNVVKVNEDHNWYITMRENHDINAIRCVCLGAYCEKAMAEDPTGQLHLFNRGFSSFIEAWSAILEAAYPRDNNAKQ
ncbi:MAG TPA: ATP-binding protein [Sedimentisphaerales bacterium]|nr:ATP-binding protein [Sedimentisphaerales bacterium]